MKFDINFGLISNEHNNSMIKHLQNHKIIPILMGKEIMQGANNEL